MTMNQHQFIFTHLPSLLHNLAKSSVEHDFSRMVAVKVNFHIFSPGALELGAERLSPRKRIVDQRPSAPIRHHHHGTGERTTAEDRVVRVSKLPVSRRTA